MLNVNYAKMFKNSFVILVLFISAMFNIACNEEESATKTPTGTVEITVLYTNDEHGWIDTSQNNSGASGMMSLWKELENYTPDGNFLVISGGDNFTGQPLSTYSAGESMIEVMNEMNYSASTIGNHEFDFGIDVLEKRLDQANFPYLACNIIEKSTGEIPDFISPYLIKEIAGVKVGLIGLTTVKTPQEVRQENVAHLDFIDYVEALDKWIPYVKNKGADIIMLLCHVPSAELTDVRKKAEEMGVVFIGAAHSHKIYNETINNVGMVEANCFLNQYAVSKIKYNRETGQASLISLELKQNQTDKSDDKIDEILAKWKKKMDSELGEVIGYTDKEIYRYSGAMQNLLCDSWLYYFPEADISVSNIGGLRASIPEGDITHASIMGVLPFENLIYELELKGSWVVDCLKPEDAIYGAVYEDGGLHFISGREFHPDSTYKVLTSNYMYTSDNYKFNKYDTEPYNTGINWRVPLVQWIIDKNTGKSNPLSQYLDTLSRRKY